MRETFRTTIRLNVLESFLSFALLLSLGQSGADPAPRTPHLPTPFDPGRSARLRGGAREGRVDPEPQGREEGQRRRPVQRDGDKRPAGERHLHHHHILHGPRRRLEGEPRHPERPRAADAALRRGLAPGRRRGMRGSVRAREGGLLGPPRAEAGSCEWTVGDGRRYRPAGRAVRAGSQAVGYFLLLLPWSTS